MKRTTRHNRQLKPLVEYPKSLYNIEPKINVYSFVEAELLPNSVDRDFFEDLRNLAPSWGKRGSLEFRLEIDHYLKTAEMTDHDQGWVNFKFKNQPSKGFEADGQRFDMFGQKLELLTKTLIKEIPWQDYRDKHIDRDTRNLLQRSSSLHSPYSATPALLKRLQEDKYQFLNCRLELNPSIDVQLNIFSQLIERLKVHKFEAVLSSLDRAYEMRVNNKCALYKRTPIGAYPLRSKVPRFRTDGITILTSRKDADKVLEAVLEIYSEKPVNFNQRPSSKLMTKVAPGIVVGDNYTYENNSLYSRTKLLSEAINLGQDYVGHYRDLDYETFEEHLSNLANRWGISDYNLAFKK